ncbi:MAG: thioredoxin family protein [Bacilli bacterium]|nr:thioredoxin family protein [Bacilli bacterium]
MKVVKINAIWCSGCLVMNKIWKNILKSKNIETINLDYDMDEDEVKKYNVGDLLPVFIFYKDDKEVKRIVGEKSEEELLKIIEEVGE